MTTQNNLEIKGNLRAYPFAELLSETTEAGLTGSFRLSSDTNKVIVYLTGGKVVFAVSNARRHRLFEILLREKKISQDQIRAVSGFANDLELCDRLTEKNILTEAETKIIFARQIEEILQFVFDWSDGEWIFSPQTRIRESIRFEVETPRILLDYARNLPENIAGQRLKDSRESFGVKPFISGDEARLPMEAFVMSRFDKTFLTISEIKQLSGLSESLTLKTLYSLWLGGFLFRKNWRAAFSERKISEILAAKLELKKEAPASAEMPAEEKAPASAIPVKPEAAAEKFSAAEKINQPAMSIESYLEQVEAAANHYEVLNLARDTDLKDIKARYFAVAKQFHPDMFHQEKDSTLVQRVQAAFAKTAQAYETLKNAEARKVYDYKLGKNLIRKPAEATDPAKSAGERQIESAKESFEAGFSLLMEDEYEESLPLLARAAQLAPDNAKYRAYYGKSLSADENQRYKADTELQAAIRLEPQNPVYRLISAEFYIQYGLFKRAEGELKRLLTISPNHPEALNLLKKLPEK